MLMILALFMLMGIPLLVERAARRKEIAKLMATGKRTSAEILEYSTGGGGKSQCIVFSFTPLGASESSRYSKLIYGSRKLKMGDRVEICYNERYPFLLALVPLGNRQDVGSQPLSNR
ncbi:hypothetical protein [Variovorax sp. PBL-E5]|uniref:hypothetical protein n=1 Tax=Variovorax sp. PBL-E5 TaxID=434014 RepID=UPI0013161BB0|nr:hypothetical protein [Variovorax sp. PBL-E5]VTU18342.1 hypothetical protein E5CHR_00568 [Variovorax sp. PBL-E5]